MNFLICLCKFLTAFSFAVAANSAAKIDRSREVTCVDLLLRHIEQQTIDGRPLPFHQAIELDSKLSLRPWARVLFRIDLVPGLSSLSEILGPTIVPAGLELEPEVSSFVHGHQFYFIASGEAQALIAFVDHLESYYEQDLKQEPVSFQILDSDILRRETFHLGFRAPMLHVSLDERNDEPALRRALAQIHEDPSRGFIVYESEIRALIYLFPAINLDPFLSSEAVRSRSKIHVVEMPTTKSLIEFLEENQGLLTSDEPAALRYYGIYLLNGNAIETLNEVSASISDFSPSHSSVPVDAELLRSLETKPEPANPQPPVKPEPLRQPEQPREKIKLPAPKPSTVQPLKIPFTSAIRSYLRMIADRVTQARLDEHGLRDFLRTKWGPVRLRVAMLFEEQIEPHLRAYDDDAEVISDSSSDPEILGLAASEQESIVPALNAEFPKLLQILSQATPGYHDAVIIEILPASLQSTRGNRVMLLQKMFTGLAEHYNWKIKTLSNSTNGQDLKSVSLLVEGEGVMQHLQFEAGTHRFIQQDVFRPSGANYRILTQQVEVAIHPAGNPTVSIAAPEGETQSPYVRTYDLRKPDSMLTGILAGPGLAAILEEELRKLQLDFLRQLAEAPP